MTSNAGMPGYELWDTESRNLLYDFDTEAEALEAAGELIDLNRSSYPGTLALVRVDASGRSTTLALGEALGGLVAQDRERRATRSA